MFKMEYLLRCFVICLLGKLLVAFSLLNSQNIGNLTGELVTGDAPENIDIFRQLLNQETIIRMALVQNVHSLMKDVLTIKNSMLVSETTVEKFKLATEKTIFQLEAEVEKLKSENQRLRDKNAEIEEKLITSVNGTFQTVQDSISQVEKKQQNFERQLKERDTKFTQLDSELQLIEARTRNLSSIAALETSLSYVSNQVQNLSQSVAFTAGVTSANPSWNSGTLVFNKIFNNIGGGYNPHTGIFTAPVAGVYVFYVTITSYSHNTIYVDIVLNGSSKVRASAPTSNKHDDTGTNMVTLQLQQGDTVWIRKGIGQGYYTHIAAPLTTFSGFLI